LRSIAKNSISFFGHISDEELREQYSGAKALIYPQLEDFGLMPLEAAACGTPTLAYGQGGALETVVPGVTGEFFGQDVVAPVGNGRDRSLQEQKNALVNQIKPLLLSWNPSKYPLNNLRQQAEKFSKEKFKDQINKFVNENCH
jgi:glycosyltransferase involved in cell wall biosynthesis